MTEARRKGRDTTISVKLTRDEIDDLVQLARYYERSMGPMRHVVRLTSSGVIRRRFQFVAEESRWLAAFAESVRDEEAANAGEVTFTPRSLVAFWGRALSSLNSKRSRRRLSPAALERREALAEKLRRAVERLWLQQRNIAENEIATRRASEAEWMRRLLGETSDSSAGKS